MKTRQFSAIRHVWTAATSQRIPIVKMMYSQRPHLAPSFQATSVRKRRKYSTCSQSGLATTILIGCPVSAEHLCIHIIHIIDLRIHGRINYMYLPLYNHFERQLNHKFAFRFRSLLLDVHTECGEPDAGQSLGTRHFCSPQMDTSLQKKLISSAVTRAVWRRFVTRSSGACGAKKKKISQMDVFEMRSSRRGCWHLPDCTSGKCH